VRSRSPPEVLLTFPLRHLVQLGLGGNLALQQNVVVAKELSYLAEPDADGEAARTLRPLQAAAITCRIAFGPRAGQKVLTLSGATPRETTSRQPLYVNIDGFSLHAAVRVEAHDRKRLEQLCRYIMIGLPGPTEQAVDDSSQNDQVDDRHHPECNRANRLHGQPSRRAKIVV